MAQVTQKAIMTSNMQYHTGIEYNSNREMCFCKSVIIASVNWFDEFALFEAQL